MNWEKPFIPPSLQPHVQAYTWGNKTACLTLSMTLATKFVMLFSRSIPTLTRSLKTSDSSVFIHMNSHCPQSNLWQQRIHPYIWIHTAHNLTTDSSAFIRMNSHCPHFPPVPSSGHPMQPNVPIPSLMHTILLYTDICAWGPTSIHTYLTRNLRFLTAAYLSIWIHTAHIFLLSHHAHTLWYLHEEPTNIHRYLKMKLGPLTTEYSSIYEFTLPTI